MIHSESKTGPDFPLEEFGKEKGQPLPSCQRKTEQGENKNRVAGCTLSGERGVQSGPAPKPRADFPQRWTRHPYLAGKEAADPGNVHAVTESVDFVRLVHP